MQNLYGDIASDVVGEALGSVGISGSANIGWSVTQSAAALSAFPGTRRPRGFRNSS